MSGHDRQFRPDAPLPEDSVERRIGAAWRELTRGAGQRALRQHLYGPLVEAAQVDVLDTLFAHDGIRMSELADAINVEASTATRTIERLVKTGLVDRRTDPTDQRVVCIALTDQGLSTVNEIQQRRRELLLQSLERFDQQQRNDLADLLDAFVAGVRSVTTDNEST